jgi:hypothetical protein
MKKIKYERPVLYGMDHGSQDAVGMGCGEGITYASNCKAGGLAESSCRNGTWNGGTCMVGNQEGIFYPVCGTGSGNTQACAAGTST